MEKIARAIYEWCKANELWGDNIIYFNGKAWSNTGEEWEGVKGKQIDDELYEYENKNPLDYFECANPDTLSMSFEGPLYYVLNAYMPGWEKKEAELHALLESFGYYCELGDTWNLALYKL